MAIRIILRGGYYQLNETVFIRPEDAGTTASPMYIESAPNEVPVLSGGYKITNWQKSIKKLTGLLLLLKGNFGLPKYLFPQEDCLNSGNFG
jgi:hypothetical protein